VAALRSARRQLQALRADARETARRLDLLRYQLDEIRAAKLLPGEEEDLAAERQRLQNAERITTLADAAYSALYAGGAGLQPASVMLARAAASLRQLSRLDAAAGDAAAGAESLSWQAEELARTVRAYRDAVDLDPRRLEQVEERLALIVGLKRKYGNSIPEILAFADRDAAELDALSHAEETAGELEERCAALTGECGGLAATLSAARHEAAERLSAAMEEEMRGLGVPRVRFVVQMRRRPDPDGISLGGNDAPVAVDVTGADEVEFLLSPNPGEPPKPLARIASGGETSRLMLAMKSILSAADTVPTLIFDEIDQGVGGRGGRILGQKLWGLARRHQVICVTHLAQIASHADTHFSIAKVVEGDRTVTRVRALDGDERVQEIAEMLGAAGSASRQAAAELMSEAASWKAEARAGIARQAKVETN
jgi:DNA repair protein RecN (Recombination protein N)